MKRKLKAVRNAEHKVQKLLARSARPRRLTRAMLTLRKRLDAANTRLEREKNRQK